VKGILTDHGKGRFEWSSNWPVKKTSSQTSWLILVSSVFPEENYWFEKICKAEKQCILIRCIPAIVKHLKMLFTFLLNILNVLEKRIKNTAKPHHGQKSLSA